MDGMALSLFLVAGFFGGLTSGLAGFAMGLVVSGIWLHIVTPVQTATLILGYGLVTQGVGIWKLRHALDPRAVLPFLLGGLVGVPAGTILLLTSVNPDHLRRGVGLLLIAYSLYGLARPALTPLRAGFRADLGIGMLNGLLGGMTGLTGIVVAIWCQLRGWPRDLQRAIFQPVNFVAMATGLAALGFGGAVTAETVQLYLIGLPVMLAGLWTGFKLYGRLDDALFRKLVLALLLLSGLSLILPKSLFG